MSVSDSAQQLILIAPCLFKKLHKDQAKRIH
jgi:hypothetical protein